MKGTISSKEVLNRYNIKYIANYILRRKLSFMGITIRMKKDRLPASLLFVFYYTKRPVCRPNDSVRYSFVSDIKKIIPFVDNQDSFNTWVHVAYNELIWSQFVNNLGEEDFELNFNNQKKILTILLQNLIRLKNHITRPRQFHLKKFTLNTRIFLKFSKFHLQIYLEK